MAVTQLTQQNLDDTINNNEIVVIDFWAPWCGPCKTFKPVFETAAEKHADITFAACNTEEQTELASMFKIQSIPTLIVMKNGEVVDKVVGVVPKESLIQLLDKHL